MARIKYYYDTESCRYERIKVSTWDIILNSLGFLILSFILAGGIVYVYIKYFESPEEAQLRKENEELKLYYDLLMQDMEEATAMLEDLQDRDDNIYRVIFGVEPIPEEIRRAGTGGANKYKDLLEEGLEREELIVDNYKRLEDIKKKMYIQTKSYDEVIKLAKDQKERLAAIPAIIPVSDYRRLSSGYGARIDPYLKVRRMHYGVDYSLPRGTPVYATGDGVVKFTRSSPSGYGKQIEIDHAFGYVTKYAHLDDFEVRSGEKVKRGQLIGYSGHTGKSTAPHLHYEVKKDGKPVNPVHFFSQNLTPEEYEEILELASIENQALGSY